MAKLGNQKLTSQHFMQSAHAALIAVLICTVVFTGCQLTLPAAPAVQKPADLPEPVWPTLAPFVPRENNGPIGGTLNLYGSDPLTFDPAISADGNSHKYVSQLFSGLANLNEKNLPTADIAQSCKVSNGGKTYTFGLREDARFNNGRPVTAADFKYSWERACDPNMKSITARDFLGDIVGAKEVLDGQAKEISGIKIIDDHTLEVTIDSPKAYFLSKLTYPTSFVVDKQNVESGKDWWRQPVGTGPFRLKQWERGKSIVLERNDNYYGDKARVESINIKLLSGIQMYMYEKDDIDVAEVSLVHLGRATDKTGKFYKELTVVPSLSFDYIGFNMTASPFDDVNVRLAFSHAVDKDRLVKLVYQGMSQPAHGILPPGMPVYNKNLHGLEFDINKAKEFLAKSKYAANMPAITLTYGGWGGQISSLVSSVIYEWKKNLGIDVKVRELDPQRFSYHLKEEKDQMFSYNWTADYPHPQNFLEVLFRSGNSRNYGEYSNKEIDALLEKASREPNSVRSLEMYQEIEQKLIDDAATLPLRFRQSYTLVKPYIKGYEVDASGIVKYNKISIDRSDWGKPSP